MAAPGILNGDYRLLNLLKHGPFIRRPRGWRFGTKTITDCRVDRLVASGRVASDGSSAWLVERSEAPR